jgi:hypothetical protein
MTGESWAADLDLCLQGWSGNNQKRRPSVYSHKNQDSYSHSPPNEKIKPKKGRHLSIFLLPIESAVLVSFLLWRFLHCDCDEFAS